LKDDDGHKAHPTQKPEALLYRVMLACTQPGDIVLDPFFGTGTTGAVARRLKRRWIGIERETKYVNVARERIASTLPLDESAMIVMAEKKGQPRVAFGLLVELGLDRAGGCRHRRETALAGRGEGRWIIGGRGQGRVDPQARRRFAGLTFVQRLELLAL
jgi:hypothetical protein